MLRAVGPADGPAGALTVGDRSDRAAREAGLARGLAAGGIWLSLIFLGDTLDSVFLLSRGMHHVEADGQVAAMLRDAVLVYVAQVGLGHALLALPAGLLLHLALRLWFGGPTPARRWWAAAVLLGGLSTALGYARQMVSFPPLHGWFPWLPWWVDLVSPGQVAALQGAVALALLAWRYQAWGRGAPRRFLQRLAPLAAAVGLAGLWMTLGGAPTAVPAPGPPVAASPPAAAPAQVGDPGVNIVLIGVDSLRPDRLSANGHPLPTSPHIDALLAESVVFSSAWTPLARTYPAWTSLLTGAWPTRHGVRDNLPPPDALVPGLPGLPQVLGDAGWFTAFATDDSRFSYMVPELGWQHIHQPEVSLTNFVVSGNEPRYRTFHAFMHNPLGFWLVPSLRHNQAYGKSYRPWLFNDAVVDLLGQAAGHDRFLLAMHSCVLHHPGDRIWPYTRMFGQEGYDGPNRFHYAASPTAFQLSEGPDDEGVQAHAEQDGRIYDTGVVMADELVGRVMAELRARGLLERTIVVLFSDHGEELWAPDLPYRFNGPNHGFHLLGTAQNQVVLAVRLPGAQGGGRVVTDPVRLIDLGPSMAELVGQPWPVQTDAQSLVPLLGGQADPSPRLVYMETGVSERRYWVAGHREYPFRRIQDRYEVDRTTGRVSTRAEFLPHLVAGKDRAVQVGRWRLVWHAMNRGTRVGLYDVVADPLHQRDLSRSDPARVAWLGSKLAPFLRSDGEDPLVLRMWTDLSASADEAALLEPRPEQEEQP